jgi:hypothetical protein
LVFRLFSAVCLGEGCVRSLETSDNTNHGGTAQEFSHGFSFSNCLKTEAAGRSGGFFAFSVASATKESKMIIVMKTGAKKSELAAVEKKIIELGYHPHVIYGEIRNVVGAVGEERGKEKLQILQSMPGVENVVPILKPYKLASREVQPQSSEIEIAPGLTIGGKEFIVIAGPCAVESREQICETAVAVKKSGARLLRGGAYKPRTSPYSFQGMEEDGLKLLAEARELTGLPIVTEVVNPRDVELVARYADVMQVGARNTQNFALLKILGQLDKPSAQTWHGDDNSGISDECRIYSFRRKPSNYPL